MSTKAIAGLTDAVTKIETIPAQMDPITEKIKILLKNNQEQKAQIIDLKRQNEQLQKENTHKTARLDLVEKAWTAAVNIKLEREEEIRALKAENQSLQAENTCKISQLRHTEQFVCKISDERDQLSAKLSKAIEEQNELVDKTTVVLAKMKRERTLLVQQCLQLAHALHQEKKLAGFSADEKTPAEEGSLHPSWVGEVSGVFLF